MKHSKIYYKSHIHALKFIMAALIFISFGCQKEDEPNALAPSNGNNRSHSEVYSSTSEDVFDPTESEANDLLGTFNDEVSNDDVESRSIRKSIWTLEAYLGYKLNNYNSVFNDLEMREEFVDIALDTTFEGDTMLLGDDILDAYYDIIEYHDNTLNPFEIHFLDVSYDSETNGVHKFKVEMMVGESTSEDKVDNLNYFTAGIYKPYGVSCTGNLATAINNKINTIYYSGSTHALCSSGYRMTFSNVQTHGIGRNSNCCSGSTLGNEKHIMVTAYNSCVTVGNYTDDGYDHTANGWLNETARLWDWEENKLSGGNEVISLFLIDFHYTVGTYPIYHDRWTHSPEVKTGKMFCITEFD